MRGRVKKKEREKGKEGGGERKKERKKRGFEKGRVMEATRGIKTKPITQKIRENRTNYTAIQSRTTGQEQ